MTKKLISIILSVVLMSSMFTGCHLKDNPKYQSSSFTSSNNTSSSKIDKIRNDTYLESSKPVSSIAQIDPNASPISSSINHPVSEETVSHEIESDKSKNDRIVTKSNYKFYYNSLSATKKKLYNSILDSALRCDKIADIPISTKENITEVYNFVRMDNPQLFYLPQEFSIIFVKKYEKITSMQIKFLYDEKYNSIEKVKKIQNQIKNKTNNIISSIKSKGQYEKVFAVYNYLTEGKTYSSNITDDYSMYGIILNNRGNCQSFSSTFQYLLDKLGIKTITVIGDSKGNPHQWNMAQIDGKWYYFDPTWDNPVNTSKYLHYVYFGLTYDEIKSTHSVQYLSLLPKAQSRDANYYYKNKLILKTNKLSDIKSIANLSYKINKNHISFRCSSKEIYNYMIGNMTTWLYYVINENGISYSNMSYIKNDDILLIDISME